MNTMEQKVRMAMIKARAYSIAEIADPTEKEQHAAVSRGGSAIQFIIAKGIVPSDDVQIAAMRSNPNAIQYIANPSSIVQIAALETAIKKRYNLPGAFLQNISEDAVRIVLDNCDWRLIEFPKLPDDIQVFIVHRKPDLLSKINHPGMKARILKEMMTVEV